MLEWELKSPDGGKRDQEDEKIGNHVGDGHSQKHRQERLAMSFYRSCDIPESPSRQADHAQTERHRNTPSTEEDECRESDHPHDACYEDSAIHESDGDLYE